ncbi:Gfo/Idh/MocA family protein [Actinocatenispora rupis]|uniref:Inositol 2-dehydrogenase n=1 Tax=Actinocatenispora rupis TaxID=519421 RepID=A0A8J3J3W8_9ACTN|nr:Gfo/Idh/MocA family oxidoreductase [Actinocatenispora rupis]GID15326.1 inositol 2-dehydrogenase [Actinocatenispora rupis]
MPEKLKVGVVGLGIWGQNHPMVYDDYERAELAVVCDLDAEKAKSVAAKYGCEWTTDVRELAASDVSTFSVATPDHAHSAPTRTLLEAGKNVLVEKPLTTDLAQAKELTELAESSSGLSMVDFHLRWDPQWGLIKETVDAGGIGAPVMGYIRLSDAIEVAENWLGWAGKSGPHWFLYPHTMDMMCWVLGQRPKSVYARGHKGVLAAKGVDTWDCIQTMVEFETANVTFETSWIVPDANPSVLDCHMSLYGEAGKIDYDQDYSGISFVTDKYTYPWVPLGRKNRWGKLDHYMYQPMRYFVDCVLDGVTPEGTFRDGLENVAMIEAALRSLETGAPVAMDDLR